MSEYSENKRQESIKEYSKVLAREDSGKVKREFRTLEESLASSENKAKEQDARMVNEAKAEEHILPEFNDMDAIKFDYNFHRLASHIGLSSKDLEGQAEKVEFLMDWGKRKSGSSDIVDILTVIKQIKNELGFSEIGRTALIKLYQYARLQDDSERVHKEMELLKEK